MKRASLCWLAVVLGLAACGDVCVAEIPRMDQCEVRLEPFLGEPRMEMQSLFKGQRFPNVVAAADGTVVATWGGKSVRARRSEDGGRTWGPPVTIAEPGFHGGGVTVVETSGDILAFVQDKHPPAPTHLYRSKDQGKKRGEMK